jgi:hypothetical protein
VAAPALRPLSTGEVLDVSFGLYRSMFSSLVLVAIVSRALPDALGVYVQLTGGVLAHPWVWLVQATVGAVMGAVGVAAATLLVSGAYLNAPVTAGAALRRAGSVIVRLTVLSFMTAVVVLAGTLLLVVPGVILFAGLLLSTVALVLEQPMSPTNAMNRSWQLTKGYKGKVLLTFLVAFLLLLVPTMVISVVSAIVVFSGGHAELISIVLVSLLSIFVYPFIYVVVTVLYYDLRVRKEGFDLELLADAARAS